MASLLWSGLLSPDLAARLLFPSGAPLQPHHLLASPPTARQVPSGPASLSPCDVLSTELAPSLPSGLCSHATFPMRPTPTTLFQTLPPPPWPPAFPVPIPCSTFPKALLTFSPYCHAYHLSHHNVSSLKNGIFVCFIHLYSSMAHNRCSIYTHICERTNA